MPRGRFISKDICIDRDVNNLSGFESMLAFTWLIPHLDCNGLTYGDPAIVRSMVFPRRSDISIDDMAGYIQDWVNAGLIKVYEKDNEPYIWFPNFNKHQIGLNKTREKSIIPIPEDYLTDSGKDQEEEQQNDCLKNKDKDNVNDKLSEGEEEYEGEPSPYSALSQAFVAKTQLPEGTGGMQNYSEALQNMVKVGITPDILGRAIDTMNKGGYTIKSPSSCYNTCLNIMQKKSGATDNRKEIFEMLKEA